MSAHHRRDDAGLSSVLGAILLFGLVVSTLATVQVQYVPVWDEKREGRLMDQLGSELRVLQADLVRQVGNSTGVPQGVPLTLAPPDGFSFFTGSTLPGTVQFAPGDAGLTLHADRITLLGQDGVDFYMLSEVWDPVTACAPPGPCEQTTQVADIDHLRLRITNPEALADGAYVELNLRDDGGAYAGKLVVTNRDSGSEYSLVVQVFSAASPTVPITQTTDGWKKTATDQGNYFVDALESSLGFSAVLAAAGKPMTLQWTTTMPTAATALVHTDATTGQSGAAPGLVVPNFNHQTSGGRLEVARENQRFPAQRYVLEYGALLLEQPDGAAMVAAPAFSARTDNGRTALAWAVPELVGSADTVGGTRGASVATAPLGARLDLEGLAPSLAFSLTTDHPQVWATYFAETLHAAGLRASAGQFQVTPATGSVAVQLFGPVASPTDLTNDLSLRFSDALLGLSLLPTG